MKNFILIALLMVSVVTVNANEKKEARKQKKAEKEASLIEQTKNIIEAEAWSFNATQMMPSKGQSRSIMNYSVVIKDGNVDSYLPYLGRAFSYEKIEKTTSELVILLKTKIISME